MHEEHRRALYGVICVSTAQISSLCAALQTTFKQLMHLMRVVGTARSCLGVWAGTGPKESVPVPVKSDLHQCRCYLLQNGSSL